MKIGVLGCSGRMGRAVLGELIDGRRAEVSGGTEREGHPDCGRDLGLLVGRNPQGVLASDDPEAVIRAADAVIEFSAPAASLVHAAMAARHGTAHVIGTTGLSAADQDELGRLAERIAIVWAPNMSQGVNLLLSLVEQVARALPPAAFDIEVQEMHHRHKVDAPSGTALALGQAAAAGRGVSLDEAGRLAREGVTGARPVGEIGFATLRGGDVVGEHVVIFAGDGERLELGHRATDRRIFARGAVRAALWTEGRPPGFYAMTDVLGLDRGEKP